jgi:hypothetical protein
MSKHMRMTVAGAEALIESERFSTRIRGFDVLHQIGRHDLMLKHALEERDVRVLGFVQKCFSPKPKELVRHLSTVVRGFYSDSWLRFEMARGNYLYAEDALYEVLARKKQLSVSTIEAIGFGYLRSAGELLDKYLNGRMINWKQARELYGPRAGYGVHPLVSSDGSDYWCRESESAIQAALALARMDLDVDLGQVERMLDEIPEAMNDQRMAKGAIAQLKWVLFDKGVTRHLDDLLPYFDSPRSIGADLATTLLKKKRVEELRWLIIQGVTYGADGNIKWKQDADANVEVILEHIGVTFTGAEFCYWPIVDWLENQKLMDSADRTDMKGYLEARTANQAPPPWWRWLSAGVA